MRRTTGGTKVAELLDLGGCRVLVTGASGNIGRGIALRLAQAGADLVLHYSTGRGQAGYLAAEIEAMGRSAVAIKADLTSDSSTANMFDRLTSGDIGFDGLVNSAGVQPVKMAADISRQDWRQVQEANLEGAFMVANSAIRAWGSLGVAGAIVNVASIEGLDPAAGHAHYAASKAGMLMMTRALALEHGRDGIRVNAVSPGLIEREGLEEEWPDGVERWREKAPLGRLGGADDVADAVLFLLSPAARWISGANLVVDGGMSAAARW